MCQSKWVMHWSNHLSLIFWKKSPPKLKTKTNKQTNKQTKNQTNKQTNKTIDSIYSRILPTTLIWITPGDVMVVIVWWVDLQIPVQSVPITLKLCVRILLNYFINTMWLVYLWFVTCRWFLPGTPVSSINKTDSHNIIEILVKVALTP